MVRSRALHRLLTYVRGSDSGSTGLTRPAGRVESRFQPSIAVDKIPNDCSRNAVGAQITEERN